ncbi:MAG: DUF3299 domain-containing protein [Caldilineaceae bacterium]
MTDTFNLSTAKGAKMRKEYLSRFFAFLCDLRGKKKICQSTRCEYYFYEVSIMNLLRQTTGYGIRILWILMIFLVASCGRSRQQPDAITDLAPLPTETPPVAYGASLSEWAEAVLDNPNQNAGSDDGRTGATPLDSPLPALALLSPLADPALVSPLAGPAPAESENAPPAATENDQAATRGAEASTIGTPFRFDDVVYREINWYGLIPADFGPDAIMSKYQDQLAVMEDGSPEANALYMKMQEELDNAPLNVAIDGALVRLPGFIAPLDYTDEIITEFLLVPYFGACIHVPPPPVNQTVLVKTAEGQGIKVEDSYNPFWIMGKLSSEKTTTRLAAAGYYVQDAIIEPYNP